MALLPEIGAVIADVVPFLGPWLVDPLSKGMQNDRNEL